MVNEVDVFMADGLASGEQVEVSGSAEVQALPNASPDNGDKYCGGTHCVSPYSIASVSRIKITDKHRLPINAAAGPQTA